MKKVYKEHVYTDKKHLRLTKELEEKFVKMLRDKWTHKWSSGYPDEDYDIMLYLSADIRQVLYDGIKSFFKREKIERVSEGEALEFQYVGATGTEDLDALDVDEHEWPGTHGEDW